MIHHLVDMPNLDVNIMRMAKDIANSNKPASAMNYCPADVKMDVWLHVVMTYQPAVEIFKHIWDKIEIDLVEHQHDEFDGNYVVTDLIVKPRYK